MYKKLVENRDMITNSFVKGYAVIKSNWYSGNILDEYIPFLATIISDEGMEIIDEHLLCQRMLDKYDVAIQPSVVRLVLSHAMGKGLITIIREQYVANKEILKRYVISDSEFEVDWARMITSFISFCEPFENVDNSEERIQKQIIEFIDSYDDHVIYNNIGDIDIEDNGFLYRWCNFIQSIRITDPSMYSFILGLCSANLFKNTLFYSSENHQERSNVKLYLDTPMIFALIGMDTEERKQSYEYILTKAKDAGMDLRVFDHNLEEVRGIIDRASRWIHNGQYDSAKANKATEYLHDACLDAVEITELIDGIEEKLNSLGLIVDHSAYLAEEDNFQLDEAQLMDAIKKEYGKRSLKYRTEEMYENSIRIDVRSLVMIQRKRAGGYSTNLKNCRYLFVTTNGAIAKVSKDIASEDEIARDKIPSCVTTDLLGTLLWMDYPDNSESYLNLKLLADCKALLKPTQEMIARFNIQLDEAYKRGELKEEQFLFLRSHPIVREKLLDVTSGDYSSFTDNTWREVYSRIEAHAQFEGDKKYEAERAEHDRTKQQLSSVAVLITEKDRALAESNEKLKRQQEKFSRCLARILSILLLGVPYLALSLTAIFLQNEFFTWTIRGIAIGAFTIILLVLIGIAFNKIEASIANKISKTLGE